ncbi:probable apyrase 6 [Macadamia integrifolia]|uniref:probable apyrase 6 n=1 Tax=Macadamia integrifolia TaxID=60698 RepID=UPI001C532C90|nr:probable apyrase 6 [Macadamia integrifolia]
MDYKRIGFANQAGSTAVDWTLGAFILQTVEPLELEPENLGHIVGNDTVTYLSLFAIIFLAAIAAFYVSKWRKPQLKTVYDLEKGHYIITRIPR